MDDLDAIASTGLYDHRLDHGADQGPLRVEAHGVEVLAAQGDRGGAGLLLRLLTPLASPITLVTQLAQPCDLYRVAGGRAP